MVRSGSIGCGDFGKTEVMTDNQKAMDRAKKQPKHPWRVWQGTADQARSEKAKAEVMVPLHSRVIR